MAAYILPSFPVRSPRAAARCKLRAMAGEAEDTSPQLRSLVSTCITTNIHRIGLKGVGEAESAPVLAVLSPFCRYMNSKNSRKIFYKNHPLRSFVPPTTQYNSTDIDRIDMKSGY